MTLEPDRKPPELSPEDHLAALETGLMRIDGALDAYYAAIEDQKAAIEHLVSLAIDSEKEAMRATLYRMIAEGVVRAFQSIHENHQGGNNE